MRTLSSVIWFVPLALHAGYVLATYGHLPPSLGAGERAGGTPTTLFVVEWFAIVGAANIAFLFVHLRLPRFGDRMLAVPGKEHWLATPERRAELVSRLRGVCETALTGLNVFFLAVYQYIYQVNTPTPRLSLPQGVLVFFFMLVPLVLVVMALLIAVRGLAATAHTDADGD